MCPIMVSAFICPNVYLHFTVIAHGEIDYFSVNTTSTIWAGTLEMSVMVITQKTIYVEDLEHFYADLSVSGECDRDNVDFGIKTARITIVDLTGESVDEVTELVVSIICVHCSYSSKWLYSENIHTRSSYP